MKHLTITTLILCASLFASQASAQRTPIEKYELVPTAFDHVFLDHIRDFSCRTIDLTDSQYWGQVDKDGKLYGYGMFINGDGSQIIGKFRDEQMIQGITITQNSALVGNSSFYASYSLTTGRLEFVFRSYERVLVDTKQQLDYGFVTMKYANGDQYVGEVYERKRHGFGLYYYANGDCWFGQYNKDIRSGFGALFREGGDIEVGQWEGEDERRVIHIQEKKED